MKTFVEIFIKHIDESTINQQLHDNVFTNFRKNDETIHILNQTL